MMEPAAFDAIWKNDLYALTAALDAGIGPNTRDSKGGTLLMEAVYRNQLHMVDVLLSRGANVHRKDRIGRTALHWASMLHSDVLFRTVFSAAGPRAMNLPDSDGWTPLHWLAFHGSEQMAFALFHPGIDVSILNLKGRGVQGKFLAAIQAYGEKEARWQPLRYTWIKLLMIPTRR
jgi:ankyrin repeat protein